MARLITEERRVLMGSLHTVPNIHRLFNLHKFDWMARDPGTYSEEIVWEFYASYAATLRGSISKRSKPLAQAPLTSTLVRGCPRSLTTDGTSCGVALSREMLSSERLLYFGCQYIVARAQHAEWVAAPPGWHPKATLNFVAKFFLVSWQLECRFGIVTASPPLQGIGHRPHSEMQANVKHLVRASVEAPSLSPGRVKVRGSMATSSTSHPTVDAKVDSRSPRLEWSVGWRDDGPKVQLISI
ncbi:hypothetical protein H5410_003779 [Solanum commersonii]|uniref:Integrase core domain containing protein n=1 Tax=Solanum commersonii TaxID=4109 RepID=A0A9J6B5Q7_SOLCO|nr:hypothetical protein H5410_003779 [Solanum commersonii]